MPDPTKQSTQAPLDGAPHSQFAKLWRRAYLTYQYHGLWSLMLRAVTFPLRFTPVKRFFRFGPGQGFDRTRAIRWYRTKGGRPVTVVIPSYRDADKVTALVKEHPPHNRLGTSPDHRLRRCQRAGAPRRTEEDPGHQDRAERAQRGLCGECESRYPGSWSRRRCRRPELGYDRAAGMARVVAVRLDPGDEHRDRCLGGKLLYPDDRIQFAGSVRNLDAPEWFDHRYRLKPANSVPPTSLCRCWP